MIFSILGYFLNKELITHSSLTNLRAINSSHVNQVNLYLECKRRVLNNAFNVNEDLTNISQLYEPETKQIHLKSEFIALELLHKSGHRIIYGEQEINDLPYITYSLTNELKIKGYIDLNDIQKLLRSEIPEYAHTIYFLEGKQKITRNTSVLYSSQDTIIRNYMTSSAEFTKNNIIADNAQEKFLIYTRLDDFPILVVSQIDTHLFFSELLAFRNKIIFANLFLALLLFSLAIYNSRKITSPIHKLINAVQQIRHGNLDQEIRVDRDDEIQVLAQEFELMRQKLLESSQSMEEKIQARTSALHEAQAQISHQEKMASLGLMAAGIAHEIGNPLTSISSMVQVIKRKNSDEHTIEYVNSILKNIDRISRIVRELVDFSRPSSHEEATCDINEIINSAVGIIKYDRRSKNIHFILDLDPTIPRLLAFKDHLLQVFLNVLINAIDASEGFGNEIIVRSLRNDNYIQIMFIDHGCGIPGNILNKIFEPFYTTKEVGRGTGLGLTVSYGFIKRMNGEIKVESALNRGSTFTIMLPIKEEAEVEYERQDIDS